MNNNNPNSPQLPTQPIANDLTFKQATLMFRNFVRERDWDKYHTPRNLVMALMGQVGQIAQIFQWKGEVQSGLIGFTEKEKTHVGQQIADVMSYLLRLADVSGIDVEKAIKNKLQKNRKKYPQQVIKENDNYFLQVKEQRRINREAQAQGQLIEQNKNNQTKQQNTKE